MGFLKKLGSNFGRLFGGSKKKSNVFQPAKKQGTTQPFDTENQLRKIRADWDKFTDEVKRKVNEEWGRVTTPDSDEPTALPDDGQDYPVSGKVAEAWSEWIPLISSNVDRIRYNEGSKQLQVIFKNGSLYEYDGVEWQIFQGFLNTHSPGQFVWQVLRAYGYSYRKLGTGNATSEPAAGRYDETPFAVPSWIEELQAKAGRGAVDQVPIAQKAPAGSNAPAKSPFTNENPPTKRSFPTRP